MKYTVSYVECNELYWENGKDKFIKKTAECEDDMDALLCALALHLGDDFGDFMDDYADDEDFNEDFVKQYLDYGYAEDYPCIIFWVKRGSKIIWESSTYTETFKRKRSPEWRLR